VTTIDSITARKLQQATPRERETFVQKAFEILNNQNIFNTLNTLSESTKWLQEDTDKYEECDKTIIQSMIIAEEKA
jgi:hypothetical protein